LSYTIPVVFPEYCTTVKNTKPKPLTDPTLLQFAMIQSLNIRFSVFAPLKVKTFPEGTEMVRFLIVLPVAPTNKLPDRVITSSFASNPTTLRCLNQLVN
jgi:hypothetical protein